MTEMWDGEHGPKEEETERASSSGPVHAAMNPAPAERPAPTDVQDTSVVMIDGKKKKKEEEEEPRTKNDKATDPQQLQQSMQTPQESSVTAEWRAGERQFPYCGHPGGESPKDSQPKSDSASLQEQESLDADIDYDPDPDGDLDGDLHGGEAHPCLHCERHFSTKQGLERHIHIHTTANQQTHLFKCRYCGKSFGSQVGRRRHERRHESGAKKKPGSLAGTANLLPTPGGKAGGSSPECTSPTAYIAIGSQFPVVHQPIPELAKKESRPTEVDRPFTLEEYGESKELHPCKYCNKAFGTHTNMRRHQRRIHERHLLPKGVRRKGMLPQEVSVQRLPNESPSGSPPPVYVPSADTEDEADRDEYVVDISKNISENLSFYIDGKILSTSSVSNCEVIEVNSRSAALFGLDTVIISPNQISQAFKVESKPTAAGKPLTSNLGQPTSKRRTTTPPLIPSLKMETETGFFASSSSSSSSTSSSSNVLVGGLFSQSTESAFQKEKTVYLSPKLKQLLQSQDSQKSTVPPTGDSHRLASPLSVTSLPGASGRFKRRTSSPPSSPQLSPAQKPENSNKAAEVGSVYTLKVPKLEGHRLSPVLNLTVHEDGDTVCASDKDASNRSSSSSNCGGNACNQQPLDLSSSVSKRSDVLSKTLGDSALDLSMQRKSYAEPEPKVNPPTQPPTKKRKPNTSMLEKVLMNEYAGLTSAGEEGPSSALSGLGPLPSLSPSMTSESAHPSPPSLTPVTMNPVSPATSSMTSPTPPPPVLPTIAPDMPGSPRSEPSLPVLSPKSSPRSNEDVEEAPSDTEEMAQEDVQDGVIDEDHEQLDSAPHTPVKDPPPKSSPEPSPTRPAPVEPPTAESDVPPTQNNGLTNGKPESIDQESTSLSPDSAALTSQKQHSPDAPASPNTSHNTSPPTLSPAVALPVAIKKDPVHYCEETKSDTSHAHVDADDPARPAVNEIAKEKGEDSETFCNTFVCNVCEEPFRSIKALNGHIVAHAVEWPYKCEFCVQLFVGARALLAHRTSLHGVGRIFVCSECSKEFAFLCNLEQHQKDLHPGQTCTHATVESGKLRLHNYTDPARAKEESRPSTPALESEEDGPLADPEVNGRSAEDEEEPEPEDSSEELYTTIKIMASEGSKPKGPDVRLGLNQHYPSFKPPPFPYHSRSHAGSVASATNFTTHNIPQTFSTAIRCTKCGNSFDNMPELHKHILACANASDKKRYTPKKNPITLKQIVKPQNGASSSPAAASSAGQSAFRRMGQPKRLNFNQEPSGKAKMSSLNKKKNQLVQKAISQKNKSASSVKKASVKAEEQQQEPEPHVCPHCSREFTYPASLSKHIAISCPMKPEPKKGKKGDVKPDTPQMSLRRKATDVADVAESEPKPLGKTRARSYSAAEPELLPASKGRTGAPVGRPKRPASFPASPAVTGKKRKKGQAQSSPPPPPPPPPAAVPASDTPSEPAQRPVVKAQRAGKETAPKKTTPEGNALLQARKEERFSLRTRERVGGPVTRSLQSVSTVATVEVKTEQPHVPEPKEPQETPLK